MLRARASAQCDPGHVTPDPQRAPEGSLAGLARGTLLPGELGRMIKGGCRIADGNHEGNCRCPAAPSAATCAFICASLAAWIQRGSKANRARFAARDGIHGLRERPRRV